MEDQPLISYKNVDINQQELGILNNVNFELKKGEFVYLIGKVGTGKSTFLKTIYGELDICEGEATVLGYDCLLYTSPSPRDRTRSRMPSSA